MKRSALAAALISLACAAAPAIAKEKIGDGFLCCNMRTDGSWISDANYVEDGKTMIPFGTPVKFRKFGRYRVNVEINGERQSIGNDYSRDLDDETFGRRYIVQDDPRLKLASASPKIREAVESARVTKGMTREQVLMALGYPISSENPNLDAPVWMYWLWSFSPYEVHFGTDGRVTTVEADRATKLKVWLD